MRCIAGLLMLGGGCAADRWVDDCCGAAHLDGRNRAGRFGELPYRICMGLMFDHGSGPADGGDDRSGADADGMSEANRMGFSLALELDGVGYHDWISRSDGDRYRSSCYRWSADYPVDRWITMAHLSMVVCRDLTSDRCCDDWQIYLSSVLARINGSLLPGIHGLTSTG
ncbi:hypothetical protein ACLOJK_034734 [Asimina triloba]